MMRAALIAGLAYFAVVFAAGFALGIFRTLVLAPRIGEFAAVVIELPVIVFASWIVCGWAVRRFRIAANGSPRLIMGAAAFTCLIAAEIALGVTAFDRTLADVVSDWATPAGAAGLAGQVLFALFPILQR